LIKTAANCSKLMSISSDIQKNILPSTHNQISSIYKRRLSKYLNLVSIHGERNQQIVNSIFNGRKIEEDELRRLLKEVAETKMKHQREVSATANHDIYASDLLTGMIPLQNYLRGD
jgi:hypothetical protein